MGLSLSEKFPCTVWACPSLKESLNDETLSKTQKLATVFFQCVYLFPIFFLVADAIYNLGLGIREICYYFCPDSDFVEDESENDAEVDLSDLCEEPFLPMPESVDGGGLLDQFFAQAEAHSFATPAAWINPRVNGSFEQAKADLEKDASFVLEWIEQFSYSSEERFELAKISLQHNLRATVVGVKKFNLTQEQRVEIFKLILEQPDTLLLCSDIKHFGFSLDKKREMLKLVLQQYPHKIEKSLGRVILAAGFSREERLELLKLALQADIFHTAYAIAGSNCDKQEQIELFKFALQENVFYAVNALKYSSFTEEERFELAQFALQEDAAEIQGSHCLENLALSSVHRQEIASSDPMTAAKAQQLIWQANASKDQSAPCCLILQAKSDYNSAFNTKAVLDHINTVGKTHRIALKIIDHANIRSEIALAKQEMGKQFIDLLILKGHGSPDAIRFGEGSAWYEFWTESPRYEQRSVAAEDFEGIAPEGRIFLESCCTGATNGLAQRISEVFNGIVFAPAHPAGSRMISESEDGVEAFYHFDSGRDMTRSFKHGSQLPGRCTSLLPALRLKEAELRTAEENYLLGEEDRYREGVARRRGLATAARKSHALALRSYDRARRLGLHIAKDSYFRLKYQKST